MFKINHSFNMKIGTHNSMSYLPLKKWYMYPFKFIAKCLNLSIEEQYDKGARLFDLRIGFDSFDLPEFRHGSISYRGSVYKVFEYLNSRKDTVYVRLIQEDKFYEDSETKAFAEMLFKNLCEEVLVKYPNLKFFAGNRKSDWKRLFKFSLKDLAINLIIGSMSGKKLDAIWPWLYAKKNNALNLTIPTKRNEWLLIDFIEIE